MGFGFAFLPLYVCEELKFIEKQANAAHLDLQPKFQRFADSGELRAAWRHDLEIDQRGAVVEAIAAEEALDRLAARQGVCAASHGRLNAVLPDDR